MKRMEQDGLVERHADPSDGRIQRAYLTDSGRKLLNRIAPVHNRWVSETLSRLDRKELERMFEMLGELRESILAAEH